jgi:hypothetical protein
MVAGRAILALGEAALRGVDHLIDLESCAIQKQLLQIEHSVLTPEMCDKQIELSQCVCNALQTPQADDPHMISPGL